MRDACGHAPYSKRKRSGYQDGEPRSSPSSILSDKLKEVPAVIIADLEQSSRCEITSRKETILCVPVRIHCIPLEIYCMIQLVLPRYMAILYDNEISTTLFCWNNNKQQQ